MVLPASIHLLQEFFPKGLISQTPAALDSPPVGLGAFLSTRLFQAGGKTLPSRRAVLGDSPFSEQSVDAQPTQALAGPFEIFTITAPAIRFQRLCLAQQLVSDRIEVHLVAYRLEGTATTTL